MKRLIAILLPAALTLAGCDMLGIESASDIAARRDAEGRAIGSACRQAGRALEDCFLLNRKAEKAAIFAGWREMNDYMRENKIEDVMPRYANPPEVAKAPESKDDEKPSKVDAKADVKAEPKPKKDS